MPKSRVYGLGRNLKHRPFRSPYHASAANINMRGKKYRLMGCKCCSCVDMRDKLLDIQHRKEINLGVDN